MSYVSLLKNLPEILSQPTGIAAIASLGIHGAIALIVPLVPVDSNKPKESASSKTVGVMELSQADQNRLPQIPGSSAITPQLPVQLEQSQLPQLNLNAQSSLPALPPPPAPSPSQLVLPPIPSSANNYGIASLPKQQPVRNPQANFRFDTSGFSASKFTPPPAPRFNNRDIALGDAKPLPINKLPVLPEGKLPAGLPAAQAPLPIDANPVSPVDVNPGVQTTQPRDNTSQVVQNEQQLIAQIRSLPQPGENLTIAPQGLPQGNLGNTPNLSNPLPVQGTQTAIAQINSYEQLRQAVQQQYPNAVEKGVIRDTITTDKPGIEGMVLGRLVVDPDGKILDIRFEGQSASPALQVKAREYFNQNPLKGEQQIAHHPFSLEVKNNNTAEGTQKPAPAANANLQQLLNQAATRNQGTPAPAATSKPLPLPAVNSTQPTPAATVKPLPLPAVNSTQPTPAATVKPLPLPAVNSTQSKPAATVKPLPLPAVNTNQPTPAPAATVKPLPLPAGNSNQPTPAPAATVKPLAAPENNSSRPSTSTVESGKKLIQQLREVKQERQTPNE
jgi:hypothetical protein